MTLQTINDLFFAIVDRGSERVMLSKQSGEWNPISSEEIYRSVVGVSLTLSKWGIKKGDRVAILSENRSEWTFAEFATALLGAVVVPIYPTQTPEQISFMLRDSGARIIFLSTIDQLKKFRSIKEQTAVEKCIVMDYVGVTEAIPMSRMMQEGPASRDLEFDAVARTINQADDVETIIYTSGTTGTPKGAMLTHGNLTSNFQCSLQGAEIGPADTYISFLPALAHHRPTRRLRNAASWCVDRILPRHRQPASDIIGDSSHHLCRRSASLRKNESAGSEEGCNWRQTSNL